MLSQQSRLVALMVICLAVGWASGDSTGNQTSTTKPADAAAIQTIWYDIHDLLDNPSPASDPQNRAQAKSDNATEVIKLITDDVDVDSWWSTGVTSGWRHSTRLI